MAHFPRIKPAPRKLPTTLTRQEVSALLDHPETDTILGLRDRALLTLLYGTGIRASECAGLAEKESTGRANDPCSRKAGMSARSR